MIHLHIVKTVPPHRVEELLDRIHQLATTHGTFGITNLIDEYREDVYLVPVDDKKEKANGRTQHRRTPQHRPEDRRPQGPGEVRRADWGD